MAPFFCLKTGATGPPCQAFNPARNGRKRRKGRQAGRRGRKRGAGRLPADPVADHFGSITAMIASRHPVTGGKFRNRISDFVFNREIPARKQFGLWENGQLDFGNPF